METRKLIETASVVVVSVIVIATTIIFVSAVADLSTAPESWQARADRLASERAAVLQHSNEWGPDLRKSMNYSCDKYNEETREWHSGIFMNGRCQLIR